MGAAVVADGLRHSYANSARPKAKSSAGGGTAGQTAGPREALAGVNLTVETGEIFGLLGPNGSGKTTLFKILSTLIRASSGKASILGVDIAQNPSAARKKIGVVFQYPSLDKRLTVGENMLHQGRLYGLGGAALNARIIELLTLFGLADRRDQVVQTLSGGLMRRVELAKGLLHKPDLLLLDEPSTGLDPGARRNLWDALGQLREKSGVTVLVTTHLAEEADRCTRLAIMSAGNIIVSGTPEKLKGAIGGDIISIVSSHPEKLAESIKKKFGCDTMIVRNEIRIEQATGHEFIPRLVESFPGQIGSVTLAKPTLEDVFIHHTGKSLWIEEGRAEEEA